MVAGDCEGWSAGWTPVPRPHRTVEARHRRSDLALAGCPPTCDCQRRARLTTIQVCSAQHAVVRVAAAEPVTCRGRTSAKVLKTPSRRLAVVRQAIRTRPRPRDSPDPQACASPMSPSTGDSCRHRSRQPGHRAGARRCPARGCGRRRCSQRRRRSGPSLVGRGRMCSGCVDGLGP
jgi:hypothetical protein